MSKRITCTAVQKYVPKSSPTPKIRTQDVSHLKLWSELSHRWHEQPFKGPSTRACACWCCRSCWRSGGGTAAARASAVGCRRLYHEERIHRVYTSVRANSPRVKRPELPCLQSRVSIDSTEHPACTRHYTTPFKQSVAWDLLMVCRWRAATISSYLSCASNETIQEVLFFRDLKVPTVCHHALTFCSSQLQYV